MARKRVVFLEPEGKRKGLLTYLRREIEHFLEVFPYEEEKLEKAIKGVTVIPDRPYTKSVHPLALILLLATLTEKGKGVKMISEVFSRGENP